MKTLLQRFLAETPAFWRKVRNTAGGLAAGLKVVEVAGILPDPWGMVVRTVITVASAVAATSQFTCKDTPTDQPAS